VVDFDREFKVPAFFVSPGAVMQDRSRALLQDLWQFCTPNFVGSTKTVQIRDITGPDPVIKSLRHQNICIFKPLHFYAPNTPFNTKCLDRIYLLWRTFANPKKAFACLKNAQKQAITVAGKPLKNPAKLWIRALVFLSSKNTGIFVLSNKS
jgi:hypothetical protein